jgi:crotonobetainyl-CoA:carnitine CoA-transferase CaiB-like acyl-CoA transferase
MTGPLSGIRVVDLCSVVSGPAAMATLADQGADVIKVETLSGDVMRHGRAASPGFSASFVACNRGKRSIALDLKRPEGKAILWRLVEQADVFAQNFRPGAIERLGFDYDAAKARNPGIVYLSISGVGPSGPYAGKRVYDPVIQALSGLTDIQADAQTGRPKMVRTLVADKTTAIYAAQAVTSALFARTRTGDGQHVEMAMLDAMLSFIWPEGMSPFAIVADDMQSASASAHDMIFETADGFITLGTVSNTEWQGLCGALNKPEWLTDPRFATQAARSANRQIRMLEIEAVLKGKPSAQILAALEAADVPCMPVRRRREMLDDPQVQHNGIVTVMAQPGVGAIRQARPAARFSGTPAKAPSPAPALGQDSAMILNEIGYTEIEIGAFQQSGVIAQHKA